MKPQKIIHFRPHIRIGTLYVIYLYRDLNSSLNGITGEIPKNGTEKNSRILTKYQVLNLDGYYN